MSVLLVGDDGGDGSRDALTLAAVLTPLLGAEELRVRVVTGDEREHSGAASPREDSGARLERGGSPARVLYETAVAHDAVMLVLGSSRRPGVGRILPGGVADRLLQGGPCPIAIAPLGYGNRGATEPRVIGVAFDGSPESRLALSLAAELGHAAAAALRVISVYPAPAPSENPGTGTPSSYTLMGDALRDAVEELPADLRAEPRFLANGDPAGALADQSELGVDLMVMGSRGYGPLRSVFLGGVSGKLMRKAACPVIVVPRGVTQEPG